MVMKTSEVLSLSLSFAFGVLRLTAQHTSKAELALETLGPFLVFNIITPHRSCSTTTACNNKEELADNTKKLRALPWSVNS